MTDVEPGGCMEQVRILVEGETRDHEEHALLAKRVQAFVEQYEPHTLVWEVFADPATGQVAWHEVYVSADAYLFHADNMEQQGFFDEFIRQTRLSGVRVLSPITDDRVWKRLRSFHADFLAPVAGVHR